MDSPIIDINLVWDDQLNNLQATGDQVLLGPNAVLYRGYDPRFRHTDTLEWYEPRHPAYFGSYEHAKYYSTHIPREGGLRMQPTDKMGPIYHFQTREGRTLRLWPITLQNVRNLIQDHLQKNPADRITMVRLAFAYGYLYGGVSKIRQLMQDIRRTPHDEYELEKLDRFAGKYERILNEVLLHCEDECISRAGTKDEISQEIQDACKSFCLEDTTYTGRYSMYGTDKPLIKRLSEILRPMGYHGIYAWLNPVNPLDRRTESRLKRDLKLGTQLNHDIIIFEPKKSLYTDNRDVGRECDRGPPELRMQNLSVENCPFLSKPNKIPFREIIKNGSKFPEPVWWKPGPKTRVYGTTAAEVDRSKKIWRERIRNVNAPREFGTEASSWRRRPGSSTPPTQTRGQKQTTSEGGWSLIGKQRAPSSRMGRTASRAPTTGRW